MFNVYIIRSTSDPDQIYIGATSDLKQRISDHNAGRSTHTAKFVAWKVECYIGFPVKQEAYDFERYLKSHSGRAFVKKRLWRQRSEE